MQRSACCWWRVVWALTVVGGLCPGAAAAQSDAGAPARAEPVFRVVSPKQNELKLTGRMARIVEMKTRIVRVDGFDPAVIQVTALTPTRLRIQAKAPGATPMVIVDEKAAIWLVDVSVTRD